MFKNKQLKNILLGLVLLLFLGGCAKATEITPDKVIYLDTQFLPFFQSEKFNGIFVYPFAQIINYLSPIIGVVLSIGFATLLVNLLTFPITIKSTASTQKMQEIQPELDKLKKKYEGLKDQNSMMRQQQELTALYKKNNISIGSTFLGLFITFPIMIAFLSVMRRTAAVLEGTFLGLPLSRTIGEGFNLGKGNWLYFVIFVLMGAAQAISMLLPSFLAKRKLKRERKIKAYAQPEKQQDSQQSMMYMFLGLILLMSYSWPAAMSVYWFFSSLMNISKTLYTTYLYKSKGAV